MTIVCDHLSATLGGRLVLDDVSLTIPQRGVTAVLGLNGVGKTTLLRCIAGLVSPSTGCVRINGMEAHTAGRKMIASKVAFVSQETNPSLSFTCGQMVLMGRNPFVRPFRNPIDVDWRAATHAMDLLGIQHLCDRPFSKVSGGERKLVSIGMALAQETEVLLLDEPTAQLDVHNTQLVVRRLRGMADNTGKQVIVSLHDVNVALACSRSAIFIYDSQNVEFGSIAEMVVPERLRRLFNVDFRVFHDDGKIAWINAVLD